MQKENIKNIKKIIIGLLVGILLLWGWTKLIDINKFLQYFKKINFFWVILSIFLYIASYVLRSLRWKLILNKIRKVSIKDIFVTYWTSLFINYLIPLKTGEIIKALHIKKVYNIPTSKVLSTVFLDKFFDLTPIIFLPALIGFISFHSNKKVLFIIIIIYLMLLIFTLFLLFSIFFRQRAQAFWGHFLKPFPQNIQNKAKLFLNSFFEGLNLLNIKEVVFFVFFTLLITVLEGIYTCCLFGSLGNTVPILISYFGYTLLNLSYILPFPPATIGSNEILWVIIFCNTLGLEINMASATEIFGHALTGLILFIFGLICSNIIGITLLDALKISDGDNNG